MLRLAVERELEIIGDAARRVSEPFKLSHPEIPWRALIAQRNVISHEYDDLKLDWLWVIATDKIPPLIEVIEPLIPPLPKEIDDG